MGHSLCCLGRDVPTQTAVRYQSVAMFATNYVPTRLNVGKAHLRDRQAGSFYLHDGSRIETCGYARLTRLGEQRTLSYAQRIKQLVGPILRLRSQRLICTTHHHYNYSWYGRRTMFAILRRACRGTAHRSSAMSTMPRFQPRTCISPRAS